MWIASGESLESLPCIPVVLSVVFDASTSLPSNANHPRAHRSQRSLYVAAPFTVISQLISSAMYV